MSASLIRQRPQESVELGGVWWRITQPGSAVGTRLYRQLVALAGERVLKAVIDSLHSEAAVEDATKAAVVAGEQWGPAVAMRVLRAAHAGELPSQADFVDLQLALASLVAPSSVERISEIGAELLWESELMASRNAKAFTGPDTFGADRSSRAAWERLLDGVIPDVATRSKLEVWAFLFLCRPSSAASRTAR